MINEGGLSFQSSSNGHSINVCIASRLRNYGQGCRHGSRVAKVTRRIGVIALSLARQRRGPLLRAHLVIRVDRILEIARCEAREPRLGRHLARDRFGESQRAEAETTRFR